MSDKTENGKDKGKDKDTKKSFLSLRWKLLIGFTVLFGILFAVVFLWFFNTATEFALNRIQADLEDTVLAAVQNVDDVALLALVADGEPNEAGFSDDPRFIDQMEWLDTVHQIEPRAWPYIYVSAEEENQVYFVADLLADYDVDSSAGFMEPYTSTGYLILGLDELTFRLVDVGPVAALDDFSDWLTEKNAPAGLISMSDGLKESLAGTFPRQFGMYGDKFGRWVSAYAPITNAEGELVAAMGIDFQADYVEQVRQSIRDRMFAALGITYAVLFALVFGVSQFFTRPIVELTVAAEKIGEGDYEQDLSVMGAGRFTDEIGRLSDVFAIMVDKVYKREQTLIKQVAELKIEIDSSKQKEEVEEIVDSEFFQDLQKKAGKMREKRDKDK